MFDCKSINELNFGEYVKIILSDGNSSVDGIFCRQGGRFVAFYAVEDWHIDGLVVFPKDKISRIFKDDIITAREHIIYWNGLVLTDRYEWLEMKDYLSLFNSIMKNNKVIYASDEDEAEVGYVVFVGEDFFQLRGIDGFGAFMNEAIEYDFKDVHSIYMDDEYSKIISKYANSKNSKINY